MPLTAVRISAPNFRKHVSQYASVQELALKSNEVILAQTQITAACNALHTVKQRFCRWLLQTWDRSENDTITLTQEFLGEMLGVRRTSVTEIASRMQAEGFIRYRRGLIEVLRSAGTGATFLRLLSRGSSRRADHHGDQAGKMTAWPAGSRSAGLREILPRRRPNVGDRTDKPRRLVSKNSGNCWLAGGH